METGRASTTCYPSLSVIFPTAATPGVFDHVIENNELESAFNDLCKFLQEVQHCVCVHVNGVVSMVVGV